MVNRSVAVMRGFTSTTTAATTAPPASVFGRLDALSVPSWKKGHASRGSVGERIQVIPGFKTSAAFLSSLSANLRIADDDLFPSPGNTPVLRPTIYDIPHNLPPLSPLANTVMTDHDADDTSSAAGSQQHDPLQGVPPLTTETATSEEDVVAALKLVADSLAQQRNVAARVLIFHPLNIVVFTTLLSVVMQYLYQPGNITKMLTTASGIIMAALVLVRQMTSGYIFAAEAIGKSWLDDDQILITKFGDSVIAALVLGWEKGEGRGNRRKKWGRGVVRAWTVKLRYRGKGVGTELLEEAVRETQRRGGEEIVFADDHANSNMFLPRFFQAPLVRKDMKYRKQLEEFSNAHLGKGKR
ncbi:uncharacterized protein PV09_06690 [Verruconis gallopava]|uniref:N-acetyltransferase domain-containing protein n=1 Tax=Verruconis gallopava TaxID=253628 RepID=A0A0D2A5L4_9PEZI|nr:uncharacterized protein PV09_06690 [Verruconis gallopava]KIW01840.1 hypothetical protein PV09_06690 [Verruconis gallopava]